MYKKKVRFLFCIQLFSNFEYLAGEVKEAAAEKVDEAKDKANEVAAAAQNKTEGKKNSFSKKKKIIYTYFLSN
jgi:hypothetical protein